MPFKTKRQKLKAAERRYTVSDTIPVDYQNLEVSAIDHGPQEKIASIKTQDLKSKSATNSIEPDYNYVKMDLLKIIILAGIISIFQLVVFLFKK